MDQQQIQNDIIPALKRFLSSRDRSTVEVRRKLEEKRLARGSGADAIVDYLVGIGLVDDQRFCENRAFYRMKNHYGPHYISRELYGLVQDRSLIGRALAQIEQEDFVSGALAYLRKKDRQELSEDPEELSLWKEKQTRRLLARGFLQKQIEQAIFTYMEYQEQQEEQSS